MGPVLIETEAIVEIFHFSCGQIGTQIGAESFDRFFIKKHVILVKFSIPDSFDRLGGSLNENDWISCKIPVKNIPG